MEALIELVAIIVAGAAIGLLGKMAAPGDRASVPTPLTVVTGSVAAVCGWVIFRGLEGYDVADWPHILLALVVASVLVLNTVLVTGGWGRN